MDKKIDFSDFSLHDLLLGNLQKHGFQSPYPIQRETIPVVLANKDVFAQAQTGSGKTAAFAIPLIQQLLDLSELEDQTYHLILSPTRELAQQTHKTFEMLSEGSPLHSHCLIGGEDIEKQIKKIKKNSPHILVATPGRLIDLVERKIINIHHTKAIVFDEADRLFDMGFKKEIDRILHKIHKHRQIITLSATNNLDVLNTLYKHHSHPEEISLGTDNMVVEKINQQLAVISEDEKMPFLVQYLKNSPDIYTFIFCNTQFQTHLVAEWLRNMDIKAKPISGRLSQNKRTKLMTEFRNKDVTVLVCTDVAARGLDIEGVELVINYDVPNDPANYVHRTGRTGRAGKEGTAITLCAHSDCESFEAIKELVKIPLTKLHLEDDDFAHDLCQKPYLDKQTLTPSKRKETNTTRRQQYSQKQKIASSPRRTRDTKDANMNLSEQPSPQRSNVNASKIDRRFFEISATQEQEARKKAQTFLRLENDELLNQEILKQGKRKFFFFGPRTTTYKYTVKPIYKKLLTPFLEEILSLAGLELTVRVSFKNNIVRITFDGEDRNYINSLKMDFLTAIEQLSKVYLGQKIVFPRNLQFSIKSGKSSFKTQRSTSRQNSKRELSDDKVIEMAKKFKSQVLENKKTLTTQTFSPAHRRLIHQHIGEDARFTTTSIGDGRYKKMKISFK